MISNKNKGFGKKVSAVSVPASLYLKVYHKNERYALSSLNYFVANFIIIRNFNQSMFLYRSTYNSHGSMQEDSYTFPGL